MMFTVIVPFELMDKVDKRLYKVWYNMRQRCYNPVYKNHHRYKEQGVYICEEWYEFDVFNIQARYLPGWDEEMFMSGKLAIDKDYLAKGQKYYGREVCCWLTKSENAKVGDGTRGVKISFNR